MSRLRERIGWPAIKSESTLWVIGDNLAAFEAAAATIEAVAQRYVRSHVILSPTDEAMCAALAQRFAHLRVLALPFEHTLCVRFFIQRCNVRTVLVLEPQGELPPKLLAGLQRRAVMIVAASARPEIPLAPKPRLLAACEACIRIGSAQAEQAGQVDMSQQCLSQDEAATFLGTMLGRDLKARRGAQSIWRSPALRMLALTRHQRWHRLVAWRVRRYASLADLRVLLGTPETILCLGNGPSSEDPALDGMTFDSLFRVNHSWQKRGRFMQPDVVFTGGTATMNTMRAPILGLQNDEAELRLIQIRTLALSIHPARFFNVNDMTDALRDFEWAGARPTNGASMLALAVTLQPARLIVAGIDLFQHEAGSYPGNNKTPNDYLPAHNRATELSFLLNLLSNYHGELIIVGEILRKEWENFTNPLLQRQIEP